MKDFKTEVCTDSIDDVLFLADRNIPVTSVEICSALGEGGLTPSLAVVSVTRQTLEDKGIKTNILIRPRQGDFEYSPAEKSINMLDITFFCNAQAKNGISIGFLTEDGDIDVDSMMGLIKTAKGNELTFNRAFDLCRDPHDALEEIIDLGFSRLLTSGQQATAEAGIPLLKELVEQSAGRIEIVAAGGVNPDNVCRIAKETGVTSFHFTGRQTVESSMNFQRKGVNMGRAGTDEYILHECNLDFVERVIQKLSEL